MTATVVVGLQWGDEGKGKIVDLLAEKVEAVARFQGGNNAGHTIVLNKEKYKLHLIPSGVLYPEKKLCIGAGVVVNPQVLMGEVAGLQAKGIEPNLLISEKAHVILPLHILQDKITDKAQGKLSAGSTHRGISPVYSDKAARHGIRMVDLLDKQILSEKLDYLIKVKQNFFMSNGGDAEFDKEKLMNQLMDYGEQLSKYICNVSIELNNLLASNKPILCEGAQGVMLCVDHGLYPYGTSSNPIAGAACTGLGIGPTHINRIVGVVKAYTSRVGKGPVPSEIFDNTADHIREFGKEYGTTTGRPRRIGWIDLVTLRHAIMINGVTEIALTKVDILSGMQEIKVCTHYTHHGKKILSHPSNLAVFRKSEPVYKTFEGFEFDKIKKYKDFPENARIYIEFLEKQLKTPITMIGIGPGRKELIKK